MMEGDGGCELERRREDVRKAALFGIDFIEVGASQTTLEVYFLGKAPPDLTSANIRIEGGKPVSVSGIRVNRQADPALDDWLEIDLDQPGGWSPYTLALIDTAPAPAPSPAAARGTSRAARVSSAGEPPPDVPMQGFDPLFASAVFSFKASCPSDLDCCTPDTCEPVVAPQPDIDYLAKDYESFRKLMFGRLALTMPGWRETHLPDVGVMLVELLAYAGDHLSYYQDAVATEAYLNTARQRVSLRRHARLVDYAMHEGCNARAWLTIAVNDNVAANADVPLDLGKVAFCTPFPGAPQGRGLQASDVARAPAGSYEWFEPLWPDRSQTLQLRKAHGEIRFYTWGDCACCLPAGTTRATLLDQRIAAADGTSVRALDLHERDVLIFEEVIGPHTGNPADANPAHRQAVRLTRVTPGVDPLYDTSTGGRPIVDIEWCAEDALRFALCLSAVMPAPDCTCRDGISVARGNVVLVDSGASTCETLDAAPAAPGAVTCPTDCEPATVVQLAPPRFRPHLKGSPLTFAQPPVSACCASELVAQDPRLAVPALVLNDGAHTWTALADLLESGPDDRHVVVEMDDDGVAHLRFGNGAEGRQPDAGTVFTACYRVGNGTQGNVGAESITCLVFTQPVGYAGDLAPRNPLPASGGTAREAPAEVRMFAPNAFRSRLERAITADDYASLASDNARRLSERAAGLCGTPLRKLQGAKATLRWNGSGYEVRLAVDPLGSEIAGDALLDELDAYLAPYRRIGHDVRAAGPDYVPLDLGVSVCVMGGYQRAHVKAALRAALGTGVLADGSTGLFNPDNQTFGQGVFVSRIVAAAQAIPGVIETEVTRLSRFAPGTSAPTAKPDDVPASGVLTLGPYQIARLDNDPGTPGNGRLTLLLRGGR